MNKFIILFFAFVAHYVQAQQLNCSVKVDIQNLGNNNQTIFKTLETAVTEFVNNTNWTGKVLAPNERINCSMYFTITSFANNQFSGTLQVQSSRPIYKSSYSSPIFNYNDKDLSFNYTEFENLLYDPNSISSNLVALASFYSFLIIALDNESFVPDSGKPYFDTALNIANIAQQSNYKGWAQSTGIQNKYFLINDFISPSYSEIRKTISYYHIAMDGMYEDVENSKIKIKEAINRLNKVYSYKPNAFLTRVFYDAKSDEITSIFTGGPQIPVNDLLITLNKTSPTNTSKWIAIR
jgi:hypothetical protein